MLDGREIARAPLDAGALERALRDAGVRARSKR
jgi:hypothetical protein